MKKNILLFSVLALLIIACENESSRIEPTSNELKTKVKKYYGGYTGTDTNYLTDSLTEFYENKLLVKRENWYYATPNEYLSYTSYFEYDSNDLLKVRKVYDNNKNILRILVNYEYDSNSNIIKVKSVRENFPSYNLDSINRTTVYEYKGDTIKKIFINNIDNTSTITAYLTENNLITKSKILTEHPTSYFYDGDNNLIKSVNNNEDNLLSNENIYSYGESKLPIIKNRFGTLRNHFLTAGINHDLATKYLTRIEYVHPHRGTNYNDYLYTFDDNDRLISVKTKGSFLAYTTIDYDYY